MRIQKVCKLTASLISDPFILDFSVNYKEEEIGMKNTEFQMSTLQIPCLFQLEQILNLLEWKKIRNKGQKGKKQEHCRHLRPGLFLCFCLVLLVVH